MNGKGTLTQRLTRSAGHHPLFGRFVAMLEAVDPERAGLLRVLTYHRVDRPDRRPQLYPGLAVRPEDFEQQMRYLHQKYAPVSIEEVLEASRLDKRLPQKAVLVTFDDGYADFAENAWPLLQQYHVPAALFIPTAFPDGACGAFWWDRLYAAFRFTERRDVLSTPWGAYALAEPQQRSSAFTQVHAQIKDLPNADAQLWVDKLESELGAPQTQPDVLSWQALRRLEKEGVSIGAHTRSHPLLTRISMEEVQEEINGSIADLMQKMERSLPIFAYPGGELTGEVMEVLAQAGVRLGFTTRRGINDFRRQNPLALLRINVGPRASLALLRAQLLTRAMSVFY